jgi:hypothetical protein
VALGDVLVSRTLARYFAAHWRYGLFASYPMALIAAAGTAAAAAGIVAGGVVGAVLAPCALAGLLGLAGRFLHLDVLLAD